VPPSRESTTLRRWTSYGITTCRTWSTGRIHHAGERRAFKQPVPLSDERRLGEWAKVNELKLKCVYVCRYTCVSYLESLRIPRGCLGRGEERTLPLGRIMESPHRTSWRETVTGVKASSECWQRRQNGEEKREREREREREKGSAKDTCRRSDEIQRKDRDVSMRGDKQSLGRIPLGTKLYSAELTRSLLVLYTVVPLRFSHFLGHTPSSFLLPSLISLTFISPSFEWATPILRLWKQHRVVSPCDSPRDVHRDALSYYLA